MTQNYKLEESAISRLYDFSGVQDSFSYRAQSRALRLAAILVSNEGECLPFSGEIADFYYPGGFSDALLVRHQKRFTAVWNDKIRHRMKRFQLPLCHRRAEELICETLCLPLETVLTDALVRRAVVASCLVPLRQKVGSCFATAPAIMIHECHPLIYLEDLYELLSTGRLIRVIAGVEYAVPLSLNSGVGDLRRPFSRESCHCPGLMNALKVGSVEELQKITAPFIHQKITIEELIIKLTPPAHLKEAKAAFKSGVDSALLRAWEFTLASLSEVKMEFSRWNLYQSLGLNPEEPGGIGEALYRAIDQELQEANWKIQEFHNEALHAFEQLRMAEKLLAQSSSEPEARRLRAEAQGRLHHFHTCQEIRDTWSQKAEKLAQSFSSLIAHYDAEFPKFFQEIYDPEMVEFGSDVYEDTPAGFRLVYKHGRADASLWTPICDRDELIRSLVDFFTLTETDAPLTTLVIQHVRSEAFIQFALERMRLQGRTPWSYISGGTVDTLVKTYFSRETPPVQESRWVDSPLDLLIFILDTLKTVSTHQPLLMHSPTHAFLLQPNWDLVREGSEETGFTYTWIRDRFLRPMQTFYQEMHFSKEAQLFLMQKFSTTFTPAETMTAAELRNMLIDLNCKNVDSQLYSMLPLIPRERCPAVLQKLIGASPPIFDYPEYLTLIEIVEMAKALLASHAGSALHLEIIERARALGIAPRPFLFADTNWLHLYFAFVVNPGTGQLELWRTDPTGTLGAPMTAWNSYLSGVDRSPWVIFPTLLKIGM